MINNNLFLFLLQFTIWIEGTIQKQFWLNLGAAYILFDCIKHTLHIQAFICSYKSVINKST